MHAWGHVLPRTPSCEEQGVALSALQAAVLVAALLAVLLANFDLRWETPEPSIDVIVFNQDFSPLPLPQPEPEPKPEPLPEPEPTPAELGVKPEPEPEPAEEKPPEPLPEPKPEPLPEPEPELADLNELLKQIEDAPSAAPDPELIDIYRLRIKSLIERHLRIPEGTPGDVRAVLLVRLLPSGNLEGDPVVEQSSGFPEYDTEAVRAVIFAQPYPMPADPAVLEALRELKLTVRP